MDASKSSKTSGQKRPREPPGEEPEKTDAVPLKQKKWPGKPHGNRKYGPVIILKEDGYVIREDERPDHVIKRENAGKPQAFQQQRKEGGKGKFEECWICGGTDHRRSDCPNKAEWGADRHSVQRKLVCLGCRKRGHLLKDCPDQAGALGDKGGAFCCYNCGSNAHSIHACTEEQIGSGFTYASCFVCNGKGHLSRDCPKNAAHGLYPRGGGCKRCGSTAHFVKDCTAGQQQQQAASSSSSSWASKRRDDADEENDAEEAPAARSAPKGSWFGSSNSSSGYAARSDEADVGGNVAFDEDAGKREKKGKRPGAYPASHGKPFKGKGRK